MVYTNGIIVDVQEPDSGVNWGSLLITTGRVRYHFPSLAETGISDLNSSDDSTAKIVLFGLREAIKNGDIAAVKKLFNEISDTQFAQASTQLTWAKDLANNSIGRAGTFSPKQAACLGGFPIH
ncbi:hypothetical protein JHK87_039738 [Glycine soja]|nr:hypothetical protein JHK87_039738 [Glycine soja]